MVAIVSGSALGLNLGSNTVLGSNGAWGSAGFGRAGERVYVNAATGNLVIQGQDELLAGLGLSASALRTYNSQGALVDDNGDNWLNGPVRSVRLASGSANAAGSVVIRRDEDGSEASFSWDAGRGRYISTDGAGAFDSLSYDGTLWTFVDGSSRRSEVYGGARGQLQSIRDADGNALTLSYGANGLLSSVSTASGEVSHYDYNASRQLTQVRTAYKSSEGAGQDSLLTRVRYAYDGLGRLSTVTVDLSPQDNSVADARVFTSSYTYDGDSQRVASITQSDGAKLSFTYDGNRLRTFTDALGGMTILVYDTVNRKTEVQDALGQVTTYWYDTLGRLKQVDSPAVAGVVSRTTYDYNGNGDVTSITDAEGRSVSFEADAWGNTVRQRDAAGNVVRRVFNAQNQLLSETVATAGEPAASAPATRYVYDASGVRLRFVLSAEGRVTEYRYGGNGLRTASIQYADGRFNLSGRSYESVPTEAELNSWVSTQDRSKTQRADSRYDWRGQLLALTTYGTVDANGNGVLDGTQAVTQYVYGTAGLLLKTIDARNGVTQYTYDGLGRMLTSSNALNQLSTTSYDDAGGVVTSRLFNGRVSTSTYDRIGRLVSVIESDASAAVARWKASGVSLDGSGVVKTTTTAVWDAGVTSTQGIAGGASVSFRATQTNAYVMVGLKTDPDNGYGSSSLNWGLYLYGDGSLRYTVGGTPTTVGSYAVGDLLAVTHDGTTVRYFKNGQLLASLSAPTTQALYAATSHHTAGSKVDDLRFEPYTGTGRGIDAGTASLWKASGASLNGGSVVKTTTTAVWDAGVTSTQGIAGGASVSFRATQTNAYVMVGLKTDPDGGYGSSSLNWGLYLCGDGSLRYTVGGAPTPVGTYAVGDLLAVTHDGTTVHYFKNGQLLASLSAPTTQALYAATTHYTAGSKVGDLRFEPSAGADLLGEGGMTVDLHDASKSGGTPYEWSSSVRSRIGYTGGASVSFRAAQTEKHFMVGLNSDPSTDAGYQGLDWAMYCIPGGQIHVYESGVYKGGLGYYAAGDALSVSYDGKAVNYIRNGVVLRSVAAVIAQPLYADSSFNGPAAKVTDLVFEGGPIVSAARNSYDAGGRLRMTQSATGARQWYFYDEAGRKVANVNALGLLTEFVYNKAGQLLQTVDYATQVDLTRLVDARGQASSLSLADIRPAAAGGDRKQWSIYDSAGRLAKTVTPTSSAGQGSVTEFSYDPSGRLLITRRFASTVSTSDWGASPSLAQATPGASAQDQLLRSFYDQDGLAVGSLDALGSLVENQYDAAARKVAQVQRTLASSAAQLALAQSASTALAQVRPADSGNDQKVLSFYNARGQLVGQLDGMGVFTETIYDASGNVSTQQRYSVATAGFSVGSALSSVRSAAGAVLQKTSYEYDALNRVLKQRVDPEGLNLTTTTIYDDAHRQLLVTSPLGVTDVTQFDVKGQVERVTKDSAGLKLSTRYSHDAEGRLLSSTDANGVVTNYSYDALGRKATQTVDPNGVNLVTRYSYDKQGNLARVIDPLGQHTRYVYDESGRLRYTLDPADGLTENRYDGLGKLSATVRYLAKQAGFQTVEHAQGLISNSVVNVVATPGGDQVTRYVYDAAGRQTYSVDATGAVTQYEYDAAGQLVAKKEFANAIGLPAAGSEDGQTLVVKGDYAGMYATTYADIDPGKTYKVRARLRQLSGKGYIYSGVIPKDASGNTFSSNGAYLYSAVSGHLLTPEEGWQTYEGTISGIAAAGVHDTSKFLYGTKSAAALLIYNFAGNEGSTDLGRLVEVDSVELIDMSTGAVVSGGKMAAGAAGWALDRSVSGAYGGGSVGTLTASQVMERLRPSAADRVSRYAYDAAGRQSYSVDAAGAVTQYEYDAAGQLVAKKEFANAIGLPEAGSSDGATVALGGQYTWLNNKVFVGIDTSKTYKVRAKLRQLSGTGSVYVGVITKDGNGAIQASNVQGAFSYCAVQGKEITPEMGWLTFEGTITGETAIAVGASYNKFFAGAKTASPLLLYNYSGNTRPSDLGRLVEVDSLELIDVATGTVINANAAMAAGGESWDVVGSIKGFAGVSLSFSADDIRQRLRPDAADRVTRYTYDAAGRQTHSVDAAGAVTQYEYDAAGHLVAKKEYANAIGLPEAGSSDGATVALGGHYGMLNNKVFVSIDTSRTYKVRAKLRQLSGTGSVYVGVITKDGNGAIQASNVQGSFSYCAEQGREITPEMGWVTFEGTITGETAIAVGASYNKFFAGAKTASPLLLYNYGGNTRPGDLGRLVEVDSLELIDVATGTVINANAAMAVGGESWAAAGSIQGFAGSSLSFRGDDIRQRLRPDAADRVTRYTYDAAGRLRYSVDAEGYVSEQRLDAQGRVTQTLRYTTAPSATVLEKLARTLDASTLGSAITTSERQYDAAGRLVRELDAERVERRYAYDAAGRLVLRTDAAGLPEERRTRYGYDAAGRLTRKTEADGSAVARSWVYEYDALGQLVTEFDPRAQQLTEQDDASARQLRQRLGYSAELGKLDASARRALRLSHASHYTYDAVGRQLTRTDALGGVTTTRYDALGQAVAQVDAMGSTRYWVYNAQGRVVQEIDAERYLTQHRYDTLGNRIETVQVNARVQGSLRDGVAVRLGAGGNAGDGAWVPLDVERDAHSSRRYDALGRVLSDTDAAGNTERVEYNTFGDRTAMVNRLGARATLRYDRRGLLLAETLPVQAPDAQGQLRDVTHRYEYDALGLRTRSIEAEGLPEQRITEMRYNRRGQLLQRIGAAYTTVDGTLSTPVDSFSYDALGRVIEQRAHAQWVNGQAVGGRRSLAYYNALDQKIAELSADGVLGRFEYDAASNIVRQTVHATRIALPSTAGAEVPAVAEHFNDRSLQTDYDALNRKIAVRVERLYTWEEGQRVDLLQAATVTLERNRYDAKGRLIEHIDGRGNASHDYFDALGRRVLSIDALGAVTAWDYERGALATATRETRYAAMLSGPIDAQASLGDAAVLRQRVATEARPDKTADRITVFQLDALGRVLEKRIKDVTQDLVDAQGSRTQSTADAVTTYAYNGLGAVTQMRELAAVTLDVQGQRQERWEQTDTSYDGVGRETLRSSPERSDANGARVRPRVQTRYDGLGQIRTQRQLGTNDASDTDDRVTHYEYKAGLLIAERDAANALTTYAYDALGQLVRRTAVLVHQDASTTRDLVKIYGYDAAGRLSSETDQDTGEVRDTRYNAFGEIEAKGLNGRWYESAEYSALGKVIKTNAGDGATKFYLQDANGNTTREIRASGFIQTAPATLTLAQAATHPLLYSHRYVYDARNQLIKTIDPEIQQLASSSTMVSQYNQAYVPPWSPIGLDPSGGGYWERAEVSAVPPGTQTAYTNFSLGGYSVIDGVDVSVPSQYIQNYGASGVSRVENNVLKNNIARITEYKYRKIGSTSWISAPEISKATLGGQSDGDYEYLALRGSESTYFHGKFGYKEGAITPDDGYIYAKAYRGTIAVQCRSDNPPTLLINGQTLNPVSMSNRVALFDIDKLRQAAGVSISESKSIRIFITEAETINTAGDSVRKILSEIETGLTFYNKLPALDDATSFHIATDIDSGLTRGFQHPLILNVGDISPNSVLRLTPAGGGTASYTLNTSSGRVTLDRGNIILYLADWTLPNSLRPVSIELVDPDAGRKINLDVTLQKDSVRYFVNPSSGNETSLRRDRVSLSVPGSNYCTIKMQASDGKGGEIEIKLKRTDISRAFIWDFSSYPAGLEYKFRYVSWTGTWDGGPTDTVGGGTILKNPDGTVTIKDDPLNGSYVKPAYINFSHDGASSYRYTIKSMETSAAIQGIGDRIFLQGANLIPQTGSHLYQMTYTGHRGAEAAGEPVTSGSLVVRVFADGTHVVYENNADYNSLPINFYVKGRQLEKIALRLTDPATKKSQFFYPLGKWVPPEGNKLGYTHFSVDARSISSPQSSLEYDLIVLDDKGQVLKEGDAEILQHGKIKFSSDGSSQPKVLERIITLESKPGVTITRRQKFNAFGEISEEADDRVLERMTAMLRLVSGDALAVPTDTQKAAARNQFHYNALGKLVEKVEPETYRTERNGYRWRARPLTSYGYDLLGRHTTTLDAAGNLTRLSYAEGARGDTSAAEYTFDAAGGSAQAYNSRVGGVTRVQRNVFGDVTRITDGEGQVTEQEHDAMGRLLSVRQRNVLRLRFNGSSTVQERRDITAFYAYDELGRRLRSTDALGNTSATRYDSLGRIVATTSAQGFVTRYSYEALTPTLPANPNPTLLNTIAALRKTTTTADGHTLKDETDHFGHLLTHTDMSGGLTTYTYSQGAQVVSKKGSNGALFNVQYDYYANGYLRTLTDFGSRSQHIYTYDNAGNRVTEGYHTYVGDIPLVSVANYAPPAGGDASDSDGALRGGGATAPSATQSASTPGQDALITYDELNRIVRVQDKNFFTVDYEFDANGNRRRIHATYQDGAAGLRTDAEQNYWYDYDALNRFVITKGKLSGARAKALNDASASVVAYDLFGEEFDRPSYKEGHLIAYDRAGRRVHDSYRSGNTIYDETYDYSGDGYLTQTRQSSWKREYFNAEVLPPSQRRSSDRLSASKELVIRDTTEQDRAIAVRDLDDLGRTVNAYDLHTQGTTRTTSTTYDKDSRVLGQIFTDGGDSQRDYVLNYYYYNPDLSLSTATREGAGALARSVMYTASDKSRETVTDYSYQYRDEAQQQETHKYTRTWAKQVYYNAEYLAFRGLPIPEQPTGYVVSEEGRTSFSYDVNGYIRRTEDTIAKLTQNYITDANGQVLRRERVQYDPSVSAYKTSVHDFFYADGHRVGDLSNTPEDKLRVSYAEQLARDDAARAAKPRDTFYKAPLDKARVDFDSNFEPVNDRYPGSAPAFYTVHSDAESLAGIAQNLWGDGAMWYLIAQANGLDANAALKAGQVLVIPNKLTNIHNNAHTWRPYNPAEALGSVDPTQPLPPPPPKKDGCGGLGTLIMVAVAVAVTFATHGAATQFFGPLGSFAPVAGGAAAAAGGSIASQVVGLSIGQIDSFSWRAVGQAALGGAIGEGISVMARADGVLSALNGPSLEAVVGRAALGSAVNMALRGDWNWQHVMLSALSAGIGSAVGSALNGTSIGRAIGDLGTKFAKGFASGVAVTALVGGNRRGYESVFASTLGSVLGESLVETIKDSSLPESIRNMSPQARQFAHGAIGKGMDVSNPEHMEALQSTLEAQFQGRALSDDQRYANTEVFLRARGLNSNERARVLNELVEGGVLSDQLAVRSPAPIDPNVIQLPQVTVTASSADQAGVALGAKQLDRLAQNTGAFVEEVEATIQSKPWLGYGMEALSFAAAPLGYVGQKVLAETQLGAAIESVKRRVTDVISDRFAGVGYGVDASENGGVGVMTASAMALGVVPKQVLGFVAELKGIRVGHSFELPDVQAKYPRVILPDSVKQQLGSAPAGMKNAHEHHILEVNGRAGPHRALVREGQDILREYAIDPLHGVENLTWAPNKGHTLTNAETLVNDLRMAKLAGLTRDEVVEILRAAGKKAGER